MTRRRIDRTAERLAHPESRKLEKLADRMERDASVVRQLATVTDEAFAHIAGELDALGWPRRGGDNVKVSGSSGNGLTRTEQDADRCWDLTSTREDVRDQIASLVGSHNDTCSHIRALIIITNTARRVGLSRSERESLNHDPDRQSMCRDNQIGKHGVDEWGDPLCPMPSVKQGLCQQHYDAWRYRRLRDGVSVDRDYGQAS